MLVPHLCLHNLRLNLELHEFLGFELRILLRGCEPSLKLHCLLISDHRLLLYFPPVVFLLCSLLTLRFQRLLPLSGVIRDGLAPVEKPLSTAVHLTASSSVAFCSCYRSCSIFSFIPRSVCLFSLIRLQPSWPVTCSSMSPCLHTRR